MNLSGKDRNRHQNSLEDLLTNLDRYDCPLPLQGTILSVSIEREVNKRSGP